MGNSSRLWPSFFKNISGVTLTAIAVTQLPVAKAEYNFTYGDLSGSTSVLVGGAALSTKGVNFGLGQIDFRNGENHGDRADWFEAFLKPKLELKYDLNDSVKFFSGLSFITTHTGGDGDAGGYTRGGDGKTSWEDLYLGAQYKDLSISAGRQGYVIGNGFIIADGHLGMLDEGTYWGDPRRAFEDTIILRYAGKSAFSAEAFTVTTDKHMGHQKLSGINMDYKAPYGKVGAAYIHVSDTDANFQRTAPKNGMNVYDFRLLSMKVPGIDDLTLDAEYAVQRGSGEGVEFKGNAWYAQAAYTFSALPVTPQITYRYAAFSGDDDPTDGKRESWDPLAKGYMDRGAWVIGDITGNYLLNNSNEVVGMWKAAFPITPEVTLGAAYYDFDLDKSNYYGTAVSSKEFADEAAIFADLALTKNAYITLSYNQVKPKTAAKEVFGDKDFSALQVYATYLF